MFLKYLRDLAGLWFVIQLFAIRLIECALIQGTLNQPDCKKLNHEPKACKVSEVLEKLGK